MRSDMQQGQAHQQRGKAPVLEAASTSLLMTPQD